MAVRRAIEVSGIVQGVGFRPYIYRLASERGLAGWVTNTSAGVSIEVQGELEEVEDFVARLPAEAPPLARVTGVRVRELPPKQRTALALRYVADAGYDEISHVMGTSEDAARRNVHEALRRLRTEYRP